MLLSVDTSSSVCVVCLGDELHAQLFFRTSQDQKSHSQVLLGFINELLDETHQKLSDLSGLAVVTGPGSFVGVRLGVSVIQGLAYGSGLRVWPISGLQVLAQTLYLNTAEPLIKPIKVSRNAHMGEVYIGEYKWNSDLMRPVRPDAIEKQTLETQFSDVLPSPQALYQVAKKAFSESPGILPTDLAPVYLKGADLWTKQC